MSTLLVRTGQGDVCSFAALYDATDQRIYSLVLRHSDGVDAEGLTRQVYVALWHQAHTFVPYRNHALAWVIALAHHEMVHRQPSPWWTSGGRWSAVQPSRTVLPPDTETSSLTRCQQDILTLVCLGGYSSREVAELMQMSRAAVTRTVRVGLSRIRAELPAAS